MLRKYDTSRSVARKLDAVRAKRHSVSGEISHSRREISRSPAVLVLERDALLCWALHETLTDAGFRVLTVPSCACAEPWSPEIDQDLALVLVDDDVWPLDGSTRAFLGTRFPGLPIVVMTNDVDPATDATLRAHGASEVLVKPFDLPDLVSVIECLTGYPHTQTATS